MIAASKVSYSDVALQNLPFRFVRHLLPKIAGTRHIQSAVFFFSDR
jgi:hypothetical protein